MIGNKDKIHEFCLERIRNNNYEWYITNDYLYIGVTKGKMIISQSFFDDLKEIFKWKQNVIGSNFIVLSQDTMGIEDTYLTTTEYKAILNNSN